MFPDPASPCKTFLQQLTKTTIWTVVIFARHGQSYEDATAGSDLSQDFFGSELIKDASASGYIRLILSFSLVRHRLKLGWLHQYA